jgi:hypothetical protein
MYLLNAGIQPYQHAKNKKHNNEPLDLVVAFKMIE